MALPQHIIENYRRFVDAAERTWAGIAAQAEKDGDASLAEYAARQDAEPGGDETGDTAATTAPPDYEQSTVAQLKTLAEERGIAVPGTLKADYVDALQAADAGQEDHGEEDGTHDAADGSEADGAAADAGDAGAGQAAQ